MPLNLSSSSVQQWLFSPSHLNSTPSQSDDMSLSEELKYRRKAVAKMQEICGKLNDQDYTVQRDFRERHSRPGMGGEMMLGRNDTEAEHLKAVSKEFQTLPLAKDVLTTAATYLHRFYMRYSLKGYQYQEIAPACLYIALKVEDRMNIKLNQVARVTKVAVGDPHGQTTRWEGIISKHEETILEALCYDLTLEQPLGILLAGLTALKPTLKKLKASLSGSEDGEVKDPSEDIDMDAGSGTGEGRKDKGKGREGNLGAGKLPIKEDDPKDELFFEVVLELAYVICYETVTTPLCLISLPNHIAASSLLLSLSMITKLSILDMLKKVDDTWVMAFCQRYCDPGKAGSVEDLTKGMRVTIQAILEYRDQKLINAVLDPEMKAEDLKKTRIKTEPAETQEADPFNLTELEATQAKLPLAAAKGLPIDNSANPEDVLKAAMDSAETRVEGKMSVEAVSKKPLDDLMPVDVADQVQGLVKEE